MSRAGRSALAAGAATTTGTTAMSTNACRTVELHVAVSGTSDVFYDDVRADTVR